MVKFLSRLLTKLAAQRQPGTRKSRRPTLRSDAHLAADVALCASTSTRRKSTAFSGFERLETRTLLVATLNGTPAGNLIYTGTGVVNNLTINFNAGTNEYTFADGGETITLLGTLTGIGATGSGTGSVTFNPTLLAASNLISINTGAGDDIITISGFRDGFEGLTVTNSTGANDVLNINDSIGTAANRVATNGVNIAAETINLGADIFTNNLALNVGAAATAFPINLTAASTINAGTQTATINTGAGANGLNGANSLTVNSGNVQLRGEIGLTTPLTAFTATATNAAGQVQVGTTGATTSIATTGAVALTSGTGGVLFNSNTVNSSGNNVTVTGNTTIAGQATAITGQTLNFTGTVGGSQNLALTANTGTITVGGNVAMTGTATINFSAISGIDLNGSTSAAGGITLAVASPNTITAAGALQSSGGGISVQGNLTFDGVGNVTNFANTAAGILVLGNITGNGSNLAFQQANTVSVAGAITNVDQFSINKAIAGTIADATVRNVTANNIAITATNIHAQGDLTASTQTIALTGAVVLDGTADPTITMQSGLGVGDSITITGTVNDSGAPTALELIAGNDTNVNLDGAVTVTGAIGGTTAIPSLIAAGATVNLQAVDVTTGNITLGGGTLNLGGNLSGTGGANNVIFLPNGTGGTLEVYNIPTAPPSNNMTVDTTDLSRLTASIEKMIFGGNSTGTVTLFNTVPGVINMPRNSEFRGATVNLNEIINQGANTVELFTDTLNIAQPISGTGAVTLDALNAGGTLLVNGNFAQTGWGASAVTVNNAGGTVTMNGHFGGQNVASIVVNAATLNGTAQPSAIEATGNVTLNVTTLNETGGVHSSTGSVLITGNVVSTTGPLSFLIPAGQNLQINGSVTAAGNVVIRGRGGALNTATLGGAVTTTGALQIDSTGVNTAQTVSLVGAVQANSIIVRGNQINLVNNLTATGGNVQLAGAVDLFNNVVMTSSGLGTHFVRVDGTINGNFNLESQSGLGRTFFVGVIGGVTPLANLTVRSGGANQVTHNITVTGTVDWLSGDTAAGDSISVLTGRTITAGVAIILEADTVTVNQLTQLFAPSVTVISNGAP